jgi:hypothetical protein
MIKNISEFTNEDGSIRWKELIGLIFVGKLDRMDVQSRFKEHKILDVHNNNDGVFLKIENETLYPWVSATDVYIAFVIVPDPPVPNTTSPEKIEELIKKVKKKVDKQIPLIPEDFPDPPYPWEDQPLIPPYTRPRKPWEDKPWYPPYPKRPYIGDPPPWTQPYIGDGPFWKTGDIPFPYEITCKVG